jgi:hypothetical protein
MSALRVYRDDGPAATWLGRTVGRALSLGEIALLALGAVPVVVVLAVPAHTLSTQAAALAALALILLGGASSARAGEGRLAWAAAPLLRALEYGMLVKLTALAAPGDMAACYALLALLAFHHYDAAYRLIHQRAAPPAWTRAVAGGWDGRLAVAAVLALAGGLTAGMIAAVAVLAPVLVAESVVSWVRFLGTERAPEYHDEDLEDA